MYNSNIVDPTVNLQLLHPRYTSITQEGFINVFAAGYRLLRYLNSKTEICPPFQSTRSSLLIGTVKHNAYYTHSHICH